MAKSERITIRLEPDTLEFIDELRRKNTNGKNYASRSETVRRVINDWKFRMMQPLEDIVLDEDKLVEELEDKGYSIEKS